MSRILLGTICGLVYGVLSAASMLPLTFTDKRAALAGAFLNRFAIGCMRCKDYFQVRKFFECL